MENDSTKWRISKSDDYQISNRYIHWSTIHLCDRWGHLSVLTCIRYSLQCQLKGDPGSSFGVSDWKNENSQKNEIKKASNYKLSQL